VRSVCGHMAEMVITRAPKVSVCNLGIGYARSSEYAARMTNFGRATWGQIHPPIRTRSHRNQNLTQRD
jgi:hypothetical protein